jgi:hypothetical protein
MRWSRTMRSGLFFLFPLFGCTSMNAAKPPEPAKAAEAQCMQQPPPTPMPAPAKAAAVATLPAPDASRANGYVTSTIALPGGGPDGIAMDYLVYNPRTKTVWVPAGNTGSVDVVEVGSGKVSSIDGFATQEIERNGKKRTVGPSAATLGPDGIVYVGNRGDFSVCAIDETKLTKGVCGKLDAMPDGISYVAKTNEVWVTTPRDKSLRILDGKTLAQTAKIELDGEPEGFAPDATRGRFYTNLEDKDLTLAIDLVSHKTVATWKPNCGEQGPHGVRLAEPEGMLIVACSARVETLDVVHDGSVVGSLDSGDGVDDLDYAASSHQVYVGAAKAATLTVAKLDSHGAMTLAAVVPTKEGARNGVATGGGMLYLAHSKQSELVVATPPETLIKRAYKTASAERDKLVRERGAIFAKIAAQRDYSGEYVVFRDNDVTAFLDLRDPQHPRYSARPGDSKRQAHILVVPNQPRESIGKTLTSDISVEDLDATIKVVHAAQALAKRLRITNPQIFIKPSETVGIGYLHVHVVGERDPSVAYPPALK